jgi:hypothetical protein
MPKECLKNISKNYFCKVYPLILKGLFQNPISTLVYANKPFVQIIELY